MRASPPVPLSAMRRGGTAWRSGRVCIACVLFTADLQRQLLALRAALGRDLQAVNGALRTASLPRIVPKAAELRRPAPETAQ